MCTLPVFEVIFSRCVFLHVGCATADGASKRSPARAQTLVLKHRLSDHKVPCTWYVVTTLTSKARPAPFSFLLGLSGFLRPTFGFGHRCTVLRIPNHHLVALIKTERNTRARYQDGNTHPAPGIEKCTCLGTRISLYI